MVKIIAGGEDITYLISNFAISGEVTSVSRILEIEIVSSATDESIPAVELPLGTEIEVMMEDESIFFGYVFNLNLSITSNNTSYTCFDSLYSLTNSNVTFNFKDTTANSATAEILGQLGLSVGSMPAVDHTFDRIFDNVNAYDAVMTLWTEQSKMDDKKYLPICEGKDIAIVEKGKKVHKYILDPKTSIVDASFSESAENMVNKVLIYDSENNKVGETSLEESPIPLTMQGIYKRDEEGSPQPDANSLLQDIEREAEIEILGDITCITGGAVVINEPYTGLNGLFYIDGDRHSFANNNYKTELKLAFENMMDEKEAGGLEEEEMYFDASGELLGDSNKEKIWSFFKSKGYSNAAISAIIGNFMQEATTGLDPSYKQKGGPGIGLLQWTRPGYNDDPRGQMLMDYAKSKGKPWTDLQTQLEFVDMEIRAMAGTDQSSKGRWEKHYPNGFAGFLQDTNVERATRAFENVMERAGRPMMENRLKYANQTYQEMKNWKPPTSSGVAGNKMIAYAKTRMGDRYVYGSSATGGTSDCSGLVWNAMKSAGYKGGRFTTRDMASMARKGILQEIPLNQAKSGDILWMNGHTGLYYGDGKTLEATPPRVGIYGFNHQRWTKAYRYAGG